MSTKKELIQNHLKKMCNFNAFESEKLKTLNYKKKLSNFFELMQFFYQTLSKETRQKQHLKKMEHLIGIQRLLNTKVKKR